MSLYRIARFSSLFFLLFLVCASPTSAQAQEPAPDSDANCITCHEHRYFLYDEGKYYIIFEAPMHCVYCHGGQTDSYNAKIAHEGMSLYPTNNQARRCQDCHPEDYLARVKTFTELAGIDPQHLVIPTAIPTSQYLPPSSPPPDLASVRWSSLGILNQAGLMLTAIGLVFIGILAYRCWKADCLMKIG